MQILDTASEERFDLLTNLASVMLGMPIALVSLVDSDRQWFKSKVGFELDETSRELAFCSHAIVDDAQPFVVEDTLLDDRFADNPLVTPVDGVRFYVGQVLLDHDGYAMGTLCAMDRRPRQLTDAQRDSLALLGKLAENELMRRSEIGLIAELDRSERAKSLVLRTMTEGVTLQDADGTMVEWNPASERILGVPQKRMGARISTDDRWAVVTREGMPSPYEDWPSTRAMRTGQPVLDEVIGVDGPDRSRVWLSVKAQPIFGDSGSLTHVLSVFNDITASVAASAAREELQAALRRSEHTARVSLNSLEQGVILSHPVTGAVHRINPAAQEILGLSYDELCQLWQHGKWVLYTEDGVLLAAEEQPICRALTTGAPVVGQVVGWRRPDGKHILVRVSCVPDVDDHGNMVSTFTDVTADHLSRRLLDATLEAAPVGLAILDQNRTIVRCNPVFAQLAGRPADDLVGIDVISLLDDERQPAAAQIGQRVQRGQTAAVDGADQRITRPDGSEIWVSTRLAVLADPNRPLAIAATFDVTERRRILSELSRFRYLFQHSNDIILIMGPAGEVLYVSPSVEKVLGYPQEYPFEGGVLAVVHPDDLAATASELTRFIAGTHESAAFTSRIKSFDGEWRSMECVAVNLLDEPAVGGIVLTARDTTERVRLTEQLAHQALHDSLTGLPNRQLMERQLSQALARAERAGSMLGVAFLDLDGFKAVNDNFGHGSGDDLLVRVAGVLESTVRAGDSAARIGGDEFVLILDPIRDIGEALGVTRRVRDEVLRLGVPGGAEIGTSIGLALSNGVDTVASLLKRADEALYLAKVTRDSSIEVAPGPARPIKAF